LSDPKSFDSIFEEMIKLTEQLFDGQVAWLTEVQPTDEDQAERDELIDRGTSFEYILEAPGYEEGQLSVSLREQRLQVKGPDFEVKKTLPSRVIPESLASRYNNGVLSVTVKKK
jgi:HSP20 family molecular chaperone IbpA